MIKLTRRLAAVAHLVREDTILADIGCDHGFLPVYLLQNGKIKSAVASDINLGPLNACKAIVQETELESKVKCVICDGLSGIGENECDDVAICGMGGELIVKILSQCEWIKNSKKHYIFNPMTHPEILRRYLCENGFEIGKDIIVKEGKRFYSVFEAAYTGKIADHNEIYYYLGNIDNFEHKNILDGLLV